MYEGGGGKFALEFKVGWFGLRTVLYGGGGGAIVGLFVGTDDV